MKNKVESQKKQILNYLENEPKATYPKIANAIGATKAEVTARLRYLFLDGYLARAENGDFVVLKK